MNEPKIKEKCLVNICAKNLRHLKFITHVTMNNGHDSSLRAELIASKRQSGLGLADVLATGRPASSRARFVVGPIAIN